ncbi:MAG: preprotein translocase subunit SecE [Proteobacteria bacterium]|nr:preprotein translocase subunit SecE [Pseudomonadota bacterium]
MKILVFLRDAWNELLTVRWPSKEEIKQLTFYVVIASIILGILVSGIDYLLNLGLSYII